MMTIVRRMRHTRASLTIAGAMASIALALPCTTLFAQSVRDSAGIRLVDNARPLWKSGEALRLSEAPSLVIGSDTAPEYKFGRIRLVRRMTDGRILVADGASQQLRFFDASGKLVGAVSAKGPETRPGSGLSLVRVLRGDTIAVGEGFADVLLFTPGGAYARSMRLPRGSRDGPPPLLSMDILPNGSRLAVPLPQPARRAPGAQWADSINFLLLDSTNGVTRDLGRLPYIRMEQTAKEQTQPWLSSIAVVAASPDHLYYGFGDRYAIHVYSPTGQLQSIVRRAWTPIPVTPADWEDWVVEWSKLWIKSTGDSAKKAMQELRDSPYAFTMPAFSQFIPDRVGRLWVREAHYQDAIAAGSLTDPPAVPSKWSVFDAKGGWLGDVTMPKDFQPYDIGSDYVLGKQYRDRKSTVVMYRLTRG